MKTAVVEMLEFGQKGQGIQSTNIAPELWQQDQSGTRSAAVTQQEQCGLIFERTS